MLSLYTVLDEKSSGRAPSSRARHARAALIHARRPELARALATEMSRPLRLPSSGAEIAETPTLLPSRGGRLFYNIAPAADEGV
jgi:hypothetical protein